MGVALWRSPTPVDTMLVPLCHRCRPALAGLLTLAIGVALFAAPVHAALPTSRGLATHRSPSPLRPTVLDYPRRIDAGRANMFTTNVGSSAFDIMSGSAGFVWPKGTNQTAIFASGLWLGCQVGGETRIAVAEYSQEYGPGPMVGGTFDDPNRPQHIVYKVKRFTGDPQDTAHVDRTPAELAADPLLDPLAHHAWSEYMFGAVPYGAPWKIYRLPDTSTPAPDDSLDIPGPDVQGDQMLWTVYNDADPSLHFNNAGQTTPLGVEIQQTTFAFDRTDELGDIVFIKFRIANKGGNTLEDMFASLWADPDLGTVTDDLVGCDVPRALGFCYNASNADGIYGSPPPAVGYVLLRGPLDPVSGDSLGLTAFGKFINGTDPGSFDETYNYMHGLLPDGSTLINPNTGQPTRYFHPGDPLTSQGWIDSNPSDRRMLLSSGPFRMLPGEMQEIVAAIVIGRGPHHLASIASVRCLSDLARDAFVRGFVPPLPSPSSPCSTAATNTPVNCPQLRPFWAFECASPGGQLSPEQLDQVASFVNYYSTLFDWPANTRDQFCATINPPGTSDLRQRTRSEFATFLANFSGSQFDLTTSGGKRIWLNPLTAFQCPPLRASNLGQLAATVSLTPVIRDATYLNNVATNRTGLEGVNFGIGFFGGGAGEGSLFLGSTLSTAANPDSFKTVEIRFSSTATQKAYRYLRLEKSSGGPPAFIGRGYPYSGFYDCNFQVWDVVNNVQLDAAFVERGLVTDDSGTLAPDTSTTIPSMNQTWAPTADGIGDREYLLVFNRPYSGTPKDELRVDNTLNMGGFPVLYVLAARLRDPSDVIDDGDAFLFDWGRPPSPGADSLMVDLEGRSLAEPAVQQAYQDLLDCLSDINAGVGIGQTCFFGPTPTLVALVSAEVVDGRVRIVWHSETAGMLANVERRSGGGEWLALGSLTPDGQGLLMFEDADVVAGTRYEYRLAVPSGDQVEYLGETSIEVASHEVLAFLGARLGSEGRKVVLSFSLATREPARIELLDVAGRRVLARELTGLDPGNHLLELGSGVRLPAGIYLVRLKQGTRSVTGKAAIVH